MVSVPYRSRQRIYFDDLDALNILHNMRYLLLMERARGELFNELGFRWEDDLSLNPDKFCVIAENRISYLAPFRGEGHVLVEVRPTHMGNSSLIVAAAVRSNDEKVLHARGETRIVRLDPQNLRPAPWSAQFRAQLLPLVGPAPAP